MRLIHHECLKAWFKKKRIIKVWGFVTTYFWSQLECELCKVPYPHEIQSLDGSQMLKVIEYETPKKINNIRAVFVVLESVSLSVSKVIHVINMARNRKCFIGRGQDADVKVTDISVSRLHASILKSSYGYFYLCDNKSKFGTLL